MKTEVKKGRLSPLNIVLLSVLLIYALSMLAMFLWSIMQSLRDSWDYTQDGPLTFDFSAITFKYYSMVITDFTRDALQLDGSTATFGIEGMFFNSIMYAVGAALAQLLMLVLLSYAVGRFKYKLNGIISSAILIAMILPVVGSLASEITIARTLGIFNTMWGMWILKAHCISIYFFVLTESFRAIPKEFSDSAELDGANGVQVIVKIMLPMVKNVLGTIFLILFVTYWNDYQTPLVYLESKPTLIYGFFMLKWVDGEFNFFPGQMAACVAVILPILIIFIIFQNKFMGNISMGGLKE